MCAMKENKEYVKDGGCACPVCGSLSIEGHSFTVESTVAYQEMSCPDCDETWDDIYHLVGYRHEGVS